MPFFIALKAFAFIFGLYIANCVLSLVDQDVFL